MAKFGPKDKGGFDPFNTISQTLTALAVEEPTPAAQGPDERVRRPIPPEPRQPVGVRPLPGPATVVQDDSGGGEQPNRPKPARAVSPASALRTTKRFKTTRGEGLRHDQAAVRLGAKLGISIDFSKLTRALWEVYLRHEEDILRNVPADGTWERPANQDAVGLAELDEQIAKLVEDGFMVASMRPKNRR